jgi:hypothetical protein
VWRFSTSTVAADPGSGNFRFDNAVPASVTAIYLDSVNQNGLNLDNLIPNISAGDEILIQQGDDPSKSVLFNVTSVPVDNTGWWTIAVTAHTDTGGLFGNNKDCLFLFSKPGGAGAGDVVGPGSSTDNAIARYDGATGKVIQNSGALLNDSDQVTAVETLTFKPEHDNGSQAAGWTLNWNNGQKQRVTLTGNGAISITDPPGAGHFTLRIIQDATGLRQPSWPASVKWPNGVTQLPSLLGSSIAVVEMYFDGTDYYATMSGGLAGYS